MPGLDKMREAKSGEQPTCTRATGRLRDGSGFYEEPLQNQHLYALQDGLTSRVSGADAGGFSDHSGDPR